MTGRRITEAQADNLRNIQPGDYWITDHGWYAACPLPVDEDGLITRLAWLKSHTVTEHEDGTITVSPSILCTGGPGQAYHGWLEHGEWRTA